MENCRGNFSNLRSQECLRQIKPEAISFNRFSNDLITDISITQEYYRNLLSEKPIPGYIQYFVKEPFIMHLYVKRQIEVLKYLTKDIVLHFGCYRFHYTQTSVLHQIYYYYALTLQHPDHHITPIPVGEMISSDQVTAEITHFLNKWYLNSKLILHKERNIDKDSVRNTSPDVVLSFNNVDIITDLDLIELCTLNYDLPSYNPISHTGKLDICNTLLNVRVSLGINNINSQMNRPLNYYIPSRTQYIPGDGNCLFSFLVYSVSGSPDNSHIIRKCIVDSNGVWGEDLELFTAVLLFKTDIWVLMKETGNSWNVFSGKGSFFDEVLNSPPANANESIYIVHTGNHYEPVLEILDKIIV
ncbi:hypothetical protein LOD99_883 [Oopsacas minuta]|uniref:OTU domain-containing protein n=1 Tax=Oopsacas minuta TaxID=111878 RepID=A0AAV7JZZ1_9METZ|nr:hypothetical protein LOD99_883 [Oopsacas minuta]